MLCFGNTQCNETITINNAFNQMFVGETLRHERCHDSDIDI